MHDPITIYTHCDELDALPSLNRENWLWETSYIASTLEKNATVLQVGSANGSRIVDLKTARPDLSIVGIDIEPNFITIAETLFEEKNISATTKLCDITNEKECERLGTFDWVLCLNHTLGWIPDEEKAIKNMRKLGKNVLVSIYGETFDNDAAAAYFKALGLKILSIDEVSIHLEDFCTVRRYGRNQIELWNGAIIKTPLGYAVRITAN